MKSSVRVSPQSAARVRFSPSDDQSLLTDSALKGAQFELAVTTQPKECGWRADVSCRRHRVEKGTRLSRLRYRDNTELRVKVNDRQIKGMKMRAIRGYVVAAPPAEQRTLLSLAKDPKISFQRVRANPHELLLQISESELR